MQAEDKRAAAAVLRRVAGQLGRAAEAVGPARGGSYADEARELEAVAAGLDAEARAEDEEDEARASWAAAMLSRGGLRF